MNNHRPKNDNAEKTAIGAALQEKSAASHLLGRCTPEHFDCLENRVIFTAIKNVFSGGLDVDVTSVYNELVRLGSKLTALELFAFTELVPSSTLIHSAVQGLEDAFVLRKVYELSHDLNKSAKDKSSVPADVLESARYKIHELISGYSKSDLVPISTDSEKYLEMAEWSYNNKGKILGIETGFKYLDKSLNGLLPTRLSILAARPSMGKSALAACIAYNIASAGVPVAFFSLEMSLLQIQERLIAISKKLNTMDVRSGQIKEFHFKKIGDALSEFESLPLYVDDAGGQSIEDIRSKARRAKDNYGIEVIIIDHMHIVDTKKRFVSRNDQLGYISSNLKDCAKENKNHVFACAQLSRSVESRKGEDQIPVLSDLRESGNIEQDADNVMFIHRWEYYQKNLPDADKIIPKSGGKSSIGKALLRIDKARDNPAPVNIMLDWMPQFTFFQEEENGPPLPKDDQAAYNMAADEIFN